MTQRMLLVGIFVMLFAVAYATFPSSEASQAPAKQSEQRSLLSHIKPGQRLMHTRYEGGLVRLEVVDDKTLAAARDQNKTIGEWPTVREVTNDYLVLEWDTEERTAKQILPKATILELWVDNRLK